MPAPQVVPEDYSQITMPLPVGGGYKMNGIDYQVVSKSDGWSPNAASIAKQYRAGKVLGMNTMAMGTPFDNEEKFELWVETAHEVIPECHIWFRPHWQRWEGDGDAEADMTADEYLNDSYDFIVDHPTFWRHYDYFSMCVEANNAHNNGNPVFTTNGQFDLAKYKDFLIKNVTYANAAFKSIGKLVKTNHMSFSLSLIDLDGQQLDSGETGRTGGFNNDDIVYYFDGLLTIDHYLSSDYRYADATKYWDRFSSDLDKLHLAFPDCKIAIGEWGYHTNTDTGAPEQWAMYERMVDVFRSKDFIDYVCFWNHMGQQSSSIFDDSSGTILPSARGTRQAVKRLFTTGNATFPRYA